MLSTQAVPPSIGTPYPKVSQASAASKAVNQLPLKPWPISVSPEISRSS